MVAINLIQSPQPIYIHAYVIISLMRLLHKCYGSSVSVITILPELGHLQNISKVDLYLVSTLVK